MQHLLAVSDSNRDPLKDEHNRVGPLGQLASGYPQFTPMIRVGVQTGEYEEAQRENTWLCLQEELACSICGTGGFSLHTPQICLAA